jgi:hypothetical protein
MTFRYVHFTRVDGILPHYDSPFTVPLQCDFCPTGSYDFDHTRSLPEFPDLSLARDGRMLSCYDAMLMSHRRDAQACPGYQAHLAHICGCPNQSKPSNCSLCVKGNPLPFAEKEVLPGLTCGEWQAFLDSGTSGVDCEVHQITGMFVQIIDIFQMKKEANPYIISQEDITAVAARQMTNSDRYRLIWTIINIFVTILSTAALIRTEQFRFFCGQLEFQSIAFLDAIDDLFFIGCACKVYEPVLPVSQWHGATTAIRTG